MNARCDDASRLDMTHVPSPLTPISRWLLHLCDRFHDGMWITSYNRAIHTPTQHNTVSATCSAFHSAHTAHSTPACTHHVAAVVDSLSPVRRRRGRRERTTSRGERRRSDTSCLPTQQYSVCAGCDDAQQGLTDTTVYVHRHDTAQQ